MHAAPAVRREELLRRWNELAADPESPDHFELNEFGELIMLRLGRQARGERARHLARASGRVVLIVTAPRVAREA
jgi:hypothetical protein